MMWWQPLNRRPTDQCGRRRRGSNARPPQINSDINNVDRHTTASWQ